MNTQSTVAGSCLCGAVSFHVAMPTLFSVHCHCTLCQRAHGAGYVTWISVLESQLHVDTGMTSLTDYQSSTHGRRSFCSRCGSQLFFRSAHHPERVDVVLAALKSPVDQAPGVHVYFSDRADWVDVSDHLPKLGGDSGIEPLDGPRETSRDAK